MSISDRLFKLRSQMAMLGVDAYIITSADEHLSEYTAEFWRFREWMTGFTGSAGTLVVTHENAGLWTDSRYFIQATKQLGKSEVKLYKIGVDNTPDYTDWLFSELEHGNVVGMNGKTISIEGLRALKKKLSEGNIRLDAKIPLEEEIWEGRIPLPEDEIYELDTQYAGLSRTEKIKLVRAEMKNMDATHYVVPMLDEIAWLLNLRGDDVENNPIFHAYVVVSHNNVNLFIDPHKITSAVGKKLAEDDIKIFLYSDFYEYINEMPKLSNVLLDPQRCNGFIYDHLPSQSKKIERLSIITRLKSKKNPVEIQNYKQAMVKDGVAMVKFLMWLNATVSGGKVTELTAAHQLQQFRSEQSDYKGNSFTTISAYGANAAMPHYAVNEKTALTLKPQGLYLVDSGAQYFQGTTDITRTIALGPITDQEKHDYTLVLKGNISLSMVSFPYGTRGSQIDVLARQAMWKQGLDYGHGTGHGVGYFLNVHEGPQSISTKDAGVALEVGMITSNEPGIYRINQHGVRLENLVLIVEDQKTEFGSFLKFETITLCPFDKSAIDISLLNDDEKKWLNAYHKMVYDSLETQLSKEEKDWLKAQTIAL